MPRARRPARAASVVVTTFGSPEAAAQVASQLVTERLAACGSVVPGVRSIYAWKGKVEDAAEALLVLKSLPGREAALERRLRELHPYDLPEVLVGRPRAQEEYRRWIADWVGAAPRRKRAR
ncbi:MAG TPA: divalent-cation tolerance protein CutA [Planctomycetota bacterium]|nr:divalent-cation tolerance protein CutA [Planctomycetota bacterium]